MYTWKKWQEAFVWCRDNASDDCSVLVSDWFESGEYGHGTVAHLKYEFPRAFFYKGFFWNGVHS